MATLINGNLNSPIFASQDADLLAAICGNQTVIAPVGNQFAHELEDANTIKVDDGVIITKEGRRIQLDAGDIDEFIIPTGTQGQTHYFLCGYHLYTDEESAELCETFVEPADSASETIDEDTFREGNTEVYVTLFRVTQVGINITDVEELLAAGTDIKGLQASVSQLNDSLTEIRRKGAMPKLDYITPLFAFDSNHLTTTTTKDCYLYGTFTFSGSTTNTQNITLTIGSISTVYKLNNGAQAPKATYSVETQLIPSGTTITITPSSASLLSDCNLYLLDVVDS